MSTHPDTQDTARATGTQATDQLAVVCEERDDAREDVARLRLALAGYMRAAAAHNVSPFDQRAHARYNHAKRAAQAALEATDPPA